MSAIFKPHAECLHPKRVLITGNPGIGKSTLCKKIAWDWAREQKVPADCFPNVEVVLLLKCCGIESGLWEAIDEQLLPWGVEKEEREQFFEFVGNNQSKVLLVLDGLDELPSHIRSTMFEVIQGRELPDCYLIATQREAGRSVQKWYDTVLEIVGFIEEDAEKFVLKYFKVKGHLILNLNSDLIENPLDTVLACFLLENVPEIFPGSRALLFKETVLSVLRRYESKKGVSSDIRDLTEIYKAELEQLGSVALRALLDDRMCFKEREWIGLTSNLPDPSFFVCSLHCKTGPRYGFFHKSFQEYLAAWFLGRRVLDGKVDPIVLLADSRYFNELNQVLFFMTGLVAEKDEELAKAIIEVVANRVNQLESDLPLECGGYVSVALRCIRECEREKRNSLAHVLGRQLRICKVAFQVNGVGVCSEVPSSQKEVSASLRKVDRTDQKIVGDVGVLVPFSSAFKVSSVVVSSLAEVLTVNTSLLMLDLSDNPIGDLGVVSLAKALTVNHTLAKLGLSRTQVGGTGVSSVARALTVNTSLTTLDLSDNPIGDLGVVSLAKALTVNHTLAKLGLSRTQVGGTGVSSVARALTVNTSLTTLDLSDNPIGDLGVVSLAKALTVNHTLAKLGLSRTQVGGTGVSSVARALTVNTSLTTLDLSDNPIGDLGVVSLAEALTANHTLAKLGLSGVQVGGTGVCSLAQALTTNTSLTTLDLSDNPIGDLSVVSLAKALTANHTLAKLGLSGVQVGGTGVCSLAQALTDNTSLTTLDLSDNPIGDPGVVSLAKALTANHTLAKLGLFGVQVGGTGVCSLAQALTTNTSLTTLDLSDNPIGDLSVVSLAQALTANHTLAKLGLSRVQMGDAGISSLAKVLRGNTSLMWLDVSGNNIGDPGAISLAEALKRNTTLENVS